MSEEQTEQRSRRVQRQAQAPSASEVKKQKLRREVEAIRRGHTTGGYCETEALQQKEKELWQALQPELEAAIERHGYSPDPKFKHAEIRALELEINGLSWRPKLVVAEAQH